jgi:hypothetical protein
VRQGKYENYRFTEKHFIKFLNGRIITWDLIKLYREYVNSTSDKSNTKRSRWSAMLRYLMKNQSFSMEEIIKENAWINYQHPFNKDIKNKYVLLSDEDYLKLQRNIPSEAVKVFIETIALTKDRVSKLVNTKRNEIIISPQFTRKILTYFPKESIFLFSTGKERHINRNYISRRITYYGNKILNKRISAESFRFIYGKSA